MTNEEQLERLVYYTNGVNNVFVFEHGTCVVGAKNEDSAKKVLAHFDVPYDGEGSPKGDFLFLFMDDGNSLISFTGERFHVCTVRTPAELDAEPNPSVMSVTEVFHTQPGANVKQARHGVSARRNRSLDAKELSVVCRHVVVPK